MIGVAHVSENYPLYYEAVNEKGLGMVGLNFVGNADYKKWKRGEIIYLLSNLFVDIGTVRYSKRSKRKIAKHKSCKCFL